MKNFRILLLFSFYLFCGQIVLFAQDLKAPIPSDPAVITGTFPNGLRYYIRSNKKPEQKVELRLMVKVGSIVEDEDQRGLAHFMEHMNFNGTKNFEKNELVSYLQSIGVEFGADLNAYTGFDQTVYILPIPTDKPGNLDKGFQILEDWAHNALLTDADIDSERGVVLEESRIGKGAEQRMLAKYLPRFVAGSKYAERLPIGKDEILKNFSYETLRRFYRDWYRPDLQGVSIVGDIDTATAMQYLRKHFASIPASTNPRPRIYEKVSERKKSESMVITDKEASSAQLILMFPYYPQKALKTVGDYRDKLRRDLLLDMLNKRLGELARGADSPFPYAYMGFNDLIRGYENFLCVTVFGEKGPEQALNAMVAELIRARKFGFSQDELTLSSRDLLSGMEKRYNERNTTDSKEFIEEYIRGFLNDEPFPGIETEFAWASKFIPGISLQEINQLMKELSGKDNLFSLITAPEKDGVSLPDEKALQKMVAKAFKQEVKPIIREKLPEQLTVALPAPGQIVAESTNPALGTVTYTLDNSVKVSVKYTDFKEDEVLLAGFKKGGYNNYPVKDRNDVRFAPEVIKAMGVGTYSPTDLEKVLSGKNVSLSADISDIKTSVSGSSTVKDLETLFQLLYLNLTAPRKDLALAETFRSSQKMVYGFAAANPQYAFFDTTFKQLYGNNPLFISPIPKVADFDKINVENTLSIYKKEFGAAEGYHFFIVGKVDTIALQELITKYLAVIPRAESYPTFTDDGLRPVNGDQKFTFKKGTEKKSMILGNYHGETPFSEDLSLHVRAVSEVLNIKIIEELREKLSAIYGGQISARLNRDPYPHYEAVIMLPCGPENVDTLLLTLNNEIKKMIEQGPDEKDLEKVKTQFHEQYRTNMKENSYWMAKLQSILGEGYSMENFLNFNERVDKLTKADLQEAARLIFGGPNKFYAILYPEN
jgi:zinc protease